MVLLIINSNNRSYNYTICIIVVITGVVEEEVRSLEDALGWLECGNAARVTSATEMNAHSSRSHAVFTISMGRYSRVCN